MKRIGIRKTYMNIDQGMVINVVKRISPTMGSAIE